MPALTIGNVTLNYQIDGPATARRTVVLSNSLSSNLRMWVHQVPALVGAGFRVVRYDSRGHGLSSAPPGPYAIADLAGDALALLDALALERVDFCGLSMGGMVGQYLGTHHGRRLHTLTLCATAAHMGPPELWDQRIATVREQGMAGVAEATIQRWFTEASRATLTEDVAQVRAQILSTPVEGYCGCCAAIRDMDQRESIRAVTLPTQIIVGADDPSTPVAASELIHERIAGSKLAIVPAAQHFLNVEQVSAFNAALLGFLNAHPV